MTAPPVIVGAGPAGLSAAIQLAQFSVSSVVLDEAPKPGGVVYRGPLRGGVALDYLGKKYQQAMSALHTAYEQHRPLIELRTLTRVLGAQGQSLLTLDSADRLLELPFEQLLLATGCHERSVPFPGWTLPGVMLLGGLQLQIKSGVIKPRGPVVLAGTGPLLPLVACQLCRAGVAVAGVYEASPLRAIAAEVVAMLNKPQLLLDGLGMLAFLKRRKVPVHYGWGVVEVRGEQSAVEVVVAPYDDAWTPDRAKAVTVAARTVAVGYGFVPRTQLSQLIGITHALRLDGVPAPVVDSHQRSSAANVFVAGDLAGVHGGEAAMLQGRIAALAMLRQRGVLTAERAATEERKHRGPLERALRFRAGFDRLSTIGAGLARLPTPDTLVCRCENVTSAHVDTALKQGVQDLISLKIRTRVGMGDCQGKICVPHCVDRLRHSTGRTDVGWSRPRFPVDPLPFSACAPEQEASDAAQP